MIRKRKRPEVERSKKAEKLVTPVRGFRVLPSSDAAAAIRAKILEQTEGPFVFNVVCVAYSSHPPGLKPRDDRSRIAWLLDGKRNTGEFAAPCQIPVLNVKYPMTVSVFNDAKIVAVGAAHENIARQTIWTTLVRIGERTGNWYYPRNFAVVNIHSIVYTYCELNLDQLAESNPLFHYEREAINMVKIVMYLNEHDESDNTRVTALVYQTGSIVLTGARERSQLVQAKDKLVPYVAHFVTRYIDSAEERARIRAHTEFLSSKLELPTADL